MDAHNVRRAFYRVIERAGIPRIRLHDLRYTYITLVRDYGLDVEVVANRVGHDSSMTTGIYSLVTDQRKRRAAKSLEKLLSEEY